MTMSKRNIKLMFILLGAVFLLIGYFAVYSPCTAKADAIQSEMDQLKPRLNTLRGYFKNIDVYRTGIQTAESTIQAEMEHYPTDVRPENMILYARTLRQHSNIDITEISFQEPVSIMEFQGVEEQNGKYQERDLTAFQRSMTITCNLGYQPMKNMIDYINNTEQRTSLDTINISYDSESGALTGDATVKQYFVTGEGDKYIAADVPDIELGKENLFGTVPTGGGQ